MTKLSTSEDMKAAVNEYIDTNDIVAACSQMMCVMNLHQKKCRRHQTDLFFIFLTV